MTQRATQFLESFAQLSEMEQHEVAVEILRQEFPWPVPPMSDDELTAVAADAFAVLDEEEAVRGQSTAR